MDKQASANTPAETANTTDTNTAPSSDDTRVRDTDLESQLRHWKAMSRKNEDRAKANAEKARKFDELEDQSKSELQKALDKASAAEQRATQAEALALRSSPRLRLTVPGRKLDKSVQLPESSSQNGQRALRKMATIIRPGASP